MLFVVVSVLVLFAVVSVLPRSFGCPGRPPPSVSHGKLTIVELNPTRLRRNGCYVTLHYRTTPHIDNQQPATKHLSPTTSVYSSPEWSRPEQETVLRYPLSPAAAFWLAAIVPSSYLEGVIASLSDERLAPSFRRHLAGQAATKYKSLVTSNVVNHLV